MKQLKALTFIKYIILFSACYLTLSTPASAITLGDIASALASQAKTIKTAFVTIFAVAAFFCVVGAAMILKKKANDDPHAKLSHVGWFFAAAIVFGGASFIISTLGETAQIEMSTY